MGRKGHGKGSQAFVERQSQYHQVASVCEPAYIILMVLSCSEELLRFIQSPGLPDEKGLSNPRLSLYLSGMLAYGLTFVHKCQVKQALSKL